MQLFSFFLCPLQNLYSILLAIVGMGFLIGFHELGHFLFCKAFGIRTPSFSIGFGPKLLSKRIGDTEFSLSAIPFGGYVEIAGNAEVGQGEQQEAHAEGPDSFKAKPYYQKMLVMLGGIFFNLIFAYAAMIAIFAIKIPKTDFLADHMTTTIKDLVKESGAARAGLQPGDTIVRIHGETKDNVSLCKAIRAAAGQTITLDIQRGDETLEKEVAVSPEGTIGVARFAVEQPMAGKSLPLGQAIAKGIEVTNKLIKNTVKSLAKLFTRGGLKGLQGPIGIISQTASCNNREGFGVFLILLAIISINLAVLNLIPLPIFDGGQLLTTTIESITGKSIPVKIKESIFTVTWLLLIFAIVIIGIKDIRAIVLPYWQTVKNFGFGALFGKK